MAHFTPQFVNSSSIWSKLLPEQSWPFPCPTSQSTNSIFWSRLVQKVISPTILLVKATKTLSPISNLVNIAKIAAAQIIPAETIPPHVDRTDAVTCFSAIYCLKPINYQSQYVTCIITAAISLMPLYENKISTNHQESLS